MPPNPPPPPEAQTWAPADLALARADLAQMARELGFDELRVSQVSLPARHAAQFRAWLDGGEHGEMAWLNKRYADPEPLGERLPGVAAVITLIANYYQPDAATVAADSSGAAARGQVSRYAIWRDYHKVLGGLLEPICERLRGSYQAQARPYVDTGPILERAHAESAGLGYIGKNTLLITQDYGSWVFLAEILTTLPLPPDDRPVKLRCGTCTRCVSACPTGAITPDNRIDARRCISYLTIEHRGPIPLELRPLIGNWLYGCDICQEVCPHNHRAQPARLDAFQRLRLPGRWLSLSELLAIRTDEQFVALFAGTPIMRAKRRGLLRNACVVAGNSGDPSLIPHLQALQAELPDALLHEHAAWAIARLAP